MKKEKMKISNLELLILLLNCSLVAKPIENKPSRADLQKEIVQLRAQLQSMQEQIKMMSNQIKRRSRPVALQKLKRKAGEVQERIEKMENELVR